MEFKFEKNDRSHELVEQFNNLIGELGILNLSFTDDDENSKRDLVVLNKSSDVFNSGSRFKLVNLLHALGITPRQVKIGIDDASSDYDPEEVINDIVKDLTINVDPFDISRKSDCMLNYFLVSI